MADFPLYRGDGRGELAGHQVGVRLIHSRWDIEAVDDFDEVDVLDLSQAAQASYSGIPGWKRLLSDAPSARLEPIDPATQPPLIGCDGLPQPGPGPYRLHLSALPDGRCQALEQLVDSTAGAGYSIRFSARVLPGATGFVSVCDSSSGRTLAATVFIGGAWQEHRLDFSVPSTAVRSLGLPLGGVACGGASSRVELDDVLLKQKHSYLVHDGQVASQRVDFVALVRARAALRATYDARAVSLLDVVTGGAILGWEYYWKDLGEGTGGYVWPANSSISFNGQSLPMNQYASLGRVLARLSAMDGRPLWRVRAATMARLFKSKLRLKDLRGLRLELLGPSAGGRSIHAFD